MPLISNLIVTRPLLAGYLYMNTSAVLTLTSEGMSRATWYIDPQGDGTVVLRSRAPAYFNYTVGFGTASMHVCNAMTQNLKVGTGAGWTPIRFIVTDPLAPPSSYATGREQSTVLLESLSRPASYAQSCGGAIVLRRDGWVNASSAFGLVPPVGCPAVCAGQTLSLSQGASTYVNINAADGTVTLAPSAGNAQTASLVALRQTVDGVTGWILTSYAAYGSGSVLTASSTCASSDATCCTAGSGGLTLAPIPATGMSTAHLFRLFWSDGAGDITSLPASPAVAGQSTCNLLASSTPLSTLTPTGSITGSITATPSSTISPGGTPSPTSE